ncbi:MAG: DUF58 domain-containing protein, partial [Anaerolineales bacterium]|nr:DUF58 domain-containing protein [Anaerolineales bacterium]
MRGRAAYLILPLLAALTVALRSPALFLLTVLLALAAGVTEVWARYCLAGVSYARRLGADRLAFGEETELWVEVVNAKPLPLAWLRVEDEIPEGLRLRETELAPASAPGRRTLTQYLNLRWYERVRRRYRLVGAQRGAHRLGPARLASGDLFGVRTQSAEAPATQTVLVYPRLVPVAELGLRPARPFGEGKAPRRVLTDPLRVAGARPYLPGDSLRHIHWKATARQGTLQTKRFEPSADPHLVIALNGQTLEWAQGGVLPELFEAGVTAAASLALAGLEAGRPVGLLTNAALAGSHWRVRVPPARHSAQTTRLLEILAQLTVFTLAPFETMLAAEQPRLPYGAT